MECEGNGMSIIEPQVDLEVLDPVRSDPVYWDAFQNRVLQAAAPELARRRARGEPVPVTDVFVAWGKALVPSALAAAALAGVLMVPRVAAEPSHMGVEEALQARVEEPVPLLLSTDHDPADPMAIRVALEGG
jgi:hypothetical protein